MACKLNDLTEKRIKMTVVATAIQVVRENQHPREEVRRHVRREAVPRREIDPAIDRETDRVIDREIDHGIEQEGKEIDLLIGCYAECYT